MPEFDFSKEPNRQERLSAETKHKLYDLFDRVIADTAPETDEEYITSLIALDEPELTNSPEADMPVLQVRKPKPEFEDKYGWAYEVVYGTQSVASSLHIIFPKNETELPPKVTSYEAEGPSIDLLGPSYPTNYPNRELMESDANKLLFDLHQAMNPSTIK